MSLLCEASQVEEAFLVLHSMNATEGEGLGRALGKALGAVDTARRLDQALSLLDSIKAATRPPFYSATFSCSQTLILI